MTATPALPLDRAGGLRCEDVDRGLEILIGSQPPGFSAENEWAATVPHVRAFAQRWDGLARAAGWKSLELYGLHRWAPFARLDAMGAAWLIARTGYQALAVDPGAIEVLTCFGNRLRIYRKAADADSALPWPHR
jgi:hypothetical protein